MYRYSTTPHAHFFKFANGGSEGKNKVASSKGFSINVQHPDD